jgi:hypothetical protein
VSKQLVFICRLTNFEYISNISVVRVQSVLRPNRVSGEAEIKVVEQVQDEEGLETQWVPRRRRLPPRQHR